MEWKYTKENPLKVVTLCSGYDSQLMAIRNLGIPYECVGWSERTPSARNAATVGSAPMHGSVFFTSYIGERAPTFAHVCVGTRKRPSQR